MGWDSKVGEIKEVYLIEEEIWRIFNSFFSNGKFTTTYKFGLLKSLIENLYNVDDNLKLSFDQIFLSFTQIYFNLVIHHNLRQSNNIKVKSSVENILMNYKSVNSGDLVFDKIKNDIKMDMVQKVKKQAKKYVFGAFYSDTRECFYEFNISKEYIKLNKLVYQFMLKYQKILIYLTNYHLALFLEKFNMEPNINHILKKVENVSKRSDLSIFYNILINFNSEQCFYCGKKLNKSRKCTHVDHFIPWSFIQNDQLWNLVLSCSSCNISKNNKIADEHFLNSLIDRNKRIMKFVDGDEKMCNYSSSKLISLYENSILNGYNNQWSPQKNIF